jgi:hypothetical protein
MVVIETPAYFRHRARSAAWFLVGALSLCGVAAAQAPPPVTTGSVIPLPHNEFNQIYKVLYYQGNILMLDTAQSVLYQMSPGSTTFTAIATGPTESNLAGPPASVGTYWNMDMAIDNEGTLYIDERYGTSTSNGLFWRVPYNSQTGSWSWNANDGWGGNIQLNGSSLLSAGSDCLAFLDSGKGDGSGTLYWMTEGSPVTIYEMPVGAGGSLSSSVPTPIVTGLIADQGEMTVDAAGNIYFVEGGTSDADRGNGVYFIPNGNTNITASGSASVESVLTSDFGMILPTSYYSASPTNKFDGVALDPAGNLYLSSESDGYGGTFNGEIMVPNICGSQANISSSGCFNWSGASYVSPVGSNHSVTVDPRGYLWIPSYGAWSFTGSAPYGGGENTTTDVCTGGACNFVLWAMGSDNLGASPVGTTTTTAGTVFVNFNDSETLGSIGFSQPGSSSDFAITTTNPYPDSTATTPTAPCVAATTPPTEYALQTTCPVWVTMTPQTVGPISGQLVMTDSSGNLISSTYLKGVGEGPLASLLGIPQQTAIASGLQTPAQVAVDTLGNVYVADSGLGEVLEYQAGSTTGKKIYGPGHPTGVAVDGSGDVYIGDSGSIYELPFVNGALGAQSTLVTSNASSGLPLGNTLNLAVDGSGDVYAADPDDKQVVEIENPQAAVSQASYSVVGTGFNQPTAVAVDNYGDLFVADTTTSGTSTLYEITVWGLQTPIDKTLSSPVTGLTVEPSGSVLVTQQGQTPGVWRIPSLAGSFTVNDVVQVDSVLTAPTSVAIDNQGNLYVTDMTGGTPNLFQLSINGAYDFGEVGVLVPQEEDVSVYNLGNEPLAFTASPTFAGTDSGDFSLTQPSLSECDTSGTTKTESGASCAFGVVITAQSQGARAGSMSVTSSATNGSLTASFTATASYTLEPTSVGITLNPTTATFPGSTTATVTVTPAPLAGSSPNTNVPSGTVTVTLTSTVQGSNQPPIVFTGQATGTDTSTTATIQLTNLPGGPYKVKAAFGGNSNFATGTQTTTLVVAPAPPAVTVPEPQTTIGGAVTLANGVYYVLTKSDTTLTATVQSPLGTPTGTVTFMNNGQVADPTQENQPLDANGQVVFNLENLAAGSYSLTAVYSGDTNFASYASAPVAFQIIPMSVLITANPASVTTPAGTPVSSTLTLESLVGFANTGVNITCNTATVPSYAECTFNNPTPAVCSPPGTTAAPCSGTTTTVLTLSTNIPTNIPSSSGNLPAQPSPFALAGVFGLGLLGLGLRKRRLISRGLFNVVCLTLLLSGAVVGFTGCTNSGYTHTPPAPHYVTPAGAYKISIVVTDEASGQQYSLPFALPVTITSASQ